MKKNAIVQIGVPVLLGLTCTVLEFFLSSICRRNTGIVLMCFGLSAAFTTGLLAIYKRYTVCGWFAVSSCGGMMVLIAYILTFPYMYINTSSVFIIAANWLAVVGVCVLVRFIKKKDDPADFNTFFRLSSIVFAAFYIAVLGYALFFQRSAARREIWGINLIPGATIMAYMKGGNNTIQAIVNLAANILLFTPLGFYLPLVCARNEMGYIESSYFFSYRLQSNPYSSCPPEGSRISTMYC